MLFYYEIQKLDRDRALVLRRQTLWTRRRLYMGSHLPGEERIRQRQRERETFIKIHDI